MSEQNKDSDQPPPLPDDLFGDTVPDSAQNTDLFSDSPPVSAEGIRFAPSSRSYLVRSYLQQAIALRQDWEEISAGSAQLHKARQMLDLGLLALMLHEGINLPERSMLQDRPPGADLVDSLSAVRNVLKADHGPVALRSILDSPAPAQEFTAADGSEAIGFVDNVLSIIIKRIAPDLDKDWQLTQPVFGDFED
ncbi:MAG: hypothetical protein Alpg2KO_22600 [Alphaproteobacteria bacterium]